MRGVLDRLYAAWAAGDADAFVADYAEDATAILTGSYRNGRQVVRDRMAEGFAGPLRGSRTQDEVQSVRFVTEDAAVVVSRSAVVLAGESAPPSDRWVMATWTLFRRDGRWLIAAYHNCPA